MFQMAKQKPTNRFRSFERILTETELENSSKYNCNQLSFIAERLNAFDARVTSVADAMPRAGRPMCMRLQWQHAGLQARQMTPRPRSARRATVMQMKCNAIAKTERKPYRLKPLY